MGICHFFVWHYLPQITAFPQFHVILLSLLIKEPCVPQYRGELLTQGVQSEYSISWITVIDPEEDTWPKHGQSGSSGWIDMDAEH